MARRQPSRPSPSKSHSQRSAKPRGRPSGGSAGPRRSGSGTGPSPTKGGGRAPARDWEHGTAPSRGEPERLQKVLAHAGVGSRRSCEELILQGRVSVDGQVVRELGTRVDPRAKIEVDGQRIRLERPVYYAVHKPKGYVSTNNDPAGRPRVIDLLPEVPERVYAVGRLDEESTGLMLLTNDGELANKLAHPKYGVEKVYRAIVAGSPTREVLDKLVEGVWLAEGKARAKRARPVGRKGEATVLEMVLAEGKNREVRRMLAKLGHKVMSLTRVAVGPISVKGLKAGDSRPLTAHEVDLLRKVAAGQPVPTAGFRDRPSDNRPARPPRRGPAKYQAARNRESAGTGEIEVYSGSEPGRPLPPSRRPRPGRERMPVSGEPAARRPPTGPAARRRATTPPPVPPTGPAARRRATTPPPVPPTGPAARRGASPPPPSGPRGAGRPPRSEPPRRKIIGLNLGEEGREPTSGPRRPRPKQRSIPPRAARPMPKPRRARPSTGEGESSE